MIDHGGPSIRQAEEEILHACWQNLPVFKPADRIHQLLHIRHNFSSIPWVAIAAQVEVPIGKNHFISGFERWVEDGARPGLLDLSHHSI